MDQHSSEYAPPEARLVVSVFQKGDDPIDAINHMMSFLTSVVTSRYLLQTTSSVHLPTLVSKQQSMMEGLLSNQFRGGRIKCRLVRRDRLHQDQEEHLEDKGCKGEGHMAKQCTKPKRKRDAEWFKNKVLLVQAQANGLVLKKEELDFLVDPGTTESSTNQTVLQEEELDFLADPGT
nr:hypothetical protein [Tanacetum cinerariifolium]